MTLSDHIDMGDVPTERPQAEPGWYDGVIDEATPQVQQTENGDKDILSLRVRLLHSDEPDLQENIGRSVYDTLWPPEKSDDSNAIKFSQLIQETGAIRAEYRGSWASLITKAADEWKGATVKVRVSQKTSKKTGETFASISRYGEKD
jgi:hypothetical protein